MKKKLMFLLAALVSTSFSSKGAPVHFEDIQYWAGEGENKAALLIQLNDGVHDCAYAWGYRWNGTATGEDMLRAIARQSSILVPLIQYTGSMGSTLNGIGIGPSGRGICDVIYYDFAGAVNGSAFDFYNPNSSMGQFDAPGDAAEQMCQEAIERARETGVIEHPINARRYGYPSYDYDFWKMHEEYAGDPQYGWQAGWYEGYWSYWVGSDGADTEDLSYSGLGMSSRQLKDGDVDLWNYAVGMVPQDPAPMVSYYMEDFNESFSEYVPPVYPVDFDQFNYTVGSGEKFSAVVFQFNDGAENDNIAYLYRWSGGWDDRISTILDKIDDSDWRLKVNKDNAAESGIASITFGGKHTATDGTWKVYACYANEPECMRVSLGNHYSNPRSVIVFKRSTDPDDNEYPVLDNVKYVEKPFITDVTFPGVAADGKIHIYPRHITGLYPTYTPADGATISNLSVEISGNGTKGQEDYLASLYAVHYWNPAHVRFSELQAYRPGQCKVTATVKNPNDASEVFVKEFDVIIENPDTSDPIDYTQGTLVLNEEWFGHTNGGLNYITPDNDVIYQAYTRENPGKAFGCTSQHGTIWNGNLFVASKQAKDNGDPLPGGGRLVIADAATLKYKGSLDTFAFGDDPGADGRAVCGAHENKIYVSTNNGIYIVDVTDATAPVVTGKVAGSEGDGNLYAGQCGDMINLGRYVAVVKQGTGILMVDTETDSVVKTIEDANAQGVAQTGDGHVYYATLFRDAESNTCSKFVEIDMATLETSNEYEMPSSIGTVACSWGAWRSTPFYGSPTDNYIWFTTGAGSIAGGGTYYYRYQPGEDASSIEPFFSLAGVKGMTQFGEEVDQSNYGTARFDYRNNRLVVMTTRKGAASGQYRDHWIHLVDGGTGELTKTIALEPYYWFQSLPIFPDTEEARLADDFNQIFVTNDDEHQEPTLVDLTEIVTDDDSYDANIRFELLQEMQANDDQGAVEVSLTGNILSLKALGSGKTNVLLNATSNGHKTTLSVPVMANVSTGVDGTLSDSRSVSVNGNRVLISGYQGTEFMLCNASGAVMTTFTADSDSYVAEFNFAPGVYVLSAKGVKVKMIVK